MLRVEEREEISSADAHKLLSAFTKSEAMLPGDMFFQLQRVQDELRRVATSEKEKERAAHAQPQQQ